MRVMLLSAVSTAALAGVAQAPGFHAGGSFATSMIPTDQPTADGFASSQLVHVRSGRVSILESDVAADRRATGGQS